MEELETVGAVETERRSGGGLWKALLFLMILAVIGGTFAVYHFGADGHIMINGQTVDNLQPWEVVGGVILGILGLIVGLVGGVVGILIGLGAALLAISLAFIGVAGSLFIVTGIVLGPFLLIALIFLMIRRSQRPEVI